MPTPKSNALKWIVTGAVVCVFLAVDFVTPLVRDIHDDWLIAIAYGICMGQVSLIATWAALAPGNVALRLPWSMLLGVFMWYGLVLGLRACGDAPALRDKAAFVGIILLVDIIAAQIPLWIARRAFRWRLVGSAAEARRSTEGPFQFYLWHLLAGMFFLSVALAPARIVLPPGDASSFGFNSEFFIVIPVVIVCNLVITIPCIWGAFAKNEKASIVAVAIGWPFYCAILTVIEFGVLAAFFGSPGGIDILWIFYLLNLSQCITVFGTLLIFRAVGFQLIRTPKPSS